LKPIMSRWRPKLLTESSKESRTMQIIWVSGPVGQIRSINISYKHLMIGFVSITLGLIICGALLQLIGFRIAVEMNPAFLRKMGNLHSATEIDNLKYFYEQKLKAIHGQVEINNQLVSKLQEQNKKLISMAIPPAMQKEKSFNNSSGGPFIPLKLKSDIGLLSSLDDSMSYLKNMNQRVEQQKDLHDQQIQWLENKPLSMPMTSGANLTSGFGRRLDPFTGTWSEHTGLDFTSAIGVPIYAAGSGVVKLAGWDGSYGQTVIIDHGDGYVSRYAHTSKILVKEGDLVKLHQNIALIGTTGRSTGPHLHFEIIKNGTPVNPVEYLTGLSQAKNVSYPE
jgi:murein DD-endopeptidase MepM/ murein hydrolase activator NlpD